MSLEQNKKRKNTQIKIDKFIFHIPISQNPNRKNESLHTFPLLQRMCRSHV